ncbi:hypothetical protein QQP08_000379 [Theobroma cacao]|nr:hypothetical protein QQP08_000379 [Theobroma cacao]
MNKKEEKLRKKEFASNVQSVALVFAFTRLRIPFSSVVVSEILGFVTSEYYMQLGTSNATVPTIPQRFFRIYVRVQQCCGMCCILSMML